MYNSTIIGTGYYVPENIVTNDDLPPEGKIQLPPWGYVPPREL